jgi:rRNA maturation endonuclease Nob1
MARVTPFLRNGLAFCPACGEPLSTEEIDWEACDSCGGDGLDRDRDALDDMDDADLNDWMERGRD